MCLKSSHFKVPFLTLLQLNDHQLYLLVKLFQLLNLFTRLLAIVIEPKHRTSFRHALFRPDTHLHLLDILLILHIKPQPRLPKIPPMNLNLLLYLNQPFFKQSPVLHKHLRLFRKQFMKRYVTLSKQLFMYDNNLCGFGLWLGLDGFRIFNKQKLEI